MEVAVHVGFRVWLRNVAQVETSALVHCCCEFANSLMTTFLVACGILCRGDATEIVSNIPYLLVILWSELMMHNAILIKENCKQLFRHASNLVSLSTDVRPSLKQCNHSKT
jgi:hypothetical protein